jgi:gentisate 1,2-dioxygenase
VSLEYTNSLTDGPAVATFACEMHRLYPGERTATHRKTGSSIYVAFRGTGRTVINGEPFAWAPGDVFVTPSWAAVDHEVDEVADIFAISDRPVLKALHLYRQETLPIAQDIIETPK